MHIAPVRRMPGNMSQLDQPVFMFGHIDPNQDTQPADALNESILRAFGDDTPVTVRPHHRPEPAASGSNSAFMFGVHPEQRTPAPPHEELLNLWTDELY
jgi:hypothetical protein